MSRYLKPVSVVMLWAFLMSFSLFAYAADAPGALTFMIKNQKTDRPLPTVQVMLTERSTNTTQTIETDEQGRVVVEGLAPGLYSIWVSKSVPKLLLPLCRTFDLATKNLSFEVERMPPPRTWLRRLA